MENTENEVDPVKAYEILLMLPREEVTLYEFEHPKHSTEEQFIRIMGIWERERAGWSRVWKEGLPRPKRARMGRPKADKPVEKKQEKAPRKEMMGLYLQLPDELVVGLSSVKGDLPLAECIRQLLAQVLGPLAKKSTDAS